MRIRSKIISFAVIAVLFIISIPAFSITGKKLTDEMILKKISFRLTEESLSQSVSSIDSKTQYISVFNELMDAQDESGGMQALIAYNYDITEDAGYNNIFDKAGSVSSAEEDLAYRKELNAYSKEYHQNTNELYARDLRENGLSIKTYDYAPYALAEITEETNAEVFWTLAASENVSLIEFIDSQQEFCTPEEADIDPQAAISPMAASSPSSLDNLSNVLKRIGMTGVEGSNEGGMSRMGLWEAEGVPALTSFPNENFHMFNYSGDMPSTHADQVASVIFAIAPAVILYSKRVTVDMDLSWFAQNYCTTINMSFATMNNNIPISKYDAMCGLIDYQLYTLRMSAFAAAGNVPTYYISRPATARNLLTVTGSRAEQVGTIINEYIDPSATYLHDNQYAKPNIAAPYTIKINKYGYLSGTSISTPLVSAAAAILITNNWALSVQPEQLYARLIAGANSSPGGGEYWPSGFSKKTGAGTLNIFKAMNAVSASANCNCDISGGVLRSITIPVRKTTIPFAAYVISPRYDSEEYYSDYGMQIMYTDYEGRPRSEYRRITCSNYWLYMYDDVEKYADFLTISILQVRYRGENGALGGIIDHVGWAYCA